MLATFTSADRGRLQLSLRDSRTVPCFARHCQTTSGSANEVSWEGIKSGGRACQRRDRDIAHYRLINVAKWRYSPNMTIIVRLDDYRAFVARATIIVDNRAIIF